MIIFWYISVHRGGVETDQTIDQIRVHLSKCDSYLTSHGVANQGDWGRDLFLVKVALKVLGHGGIVHMSMPVSSTAMISQIDHVASKVLLQLAVLRDEPEGLSLSKKTMEEDGVTLDVTLDDFGCQIELLLW